jgi:glucose/arabinose dehydrogenase
MDAYRASVRLSALLTALVVIVGGTVGSASALSLDTVETGLANPIYVTHAPGDPTRLFILERDGFIRIQHNGTLLSQPFLDISSNTTTGSERGLLGMAFHPNYRDNGYFFINYTNVDGDTRVVRYTVSANPDSADETSALTILAIDQPFGNHNAGMLAFGKDGYLYVGTGDGGSSGDPGNRAQDPQEMLGKMLRLDVDNGTPYGIPSDNPFVGSPDTLDEIWSLGLRNPWRYSFDRKSGDLYIADVGQNEWEEINVEPAGSSGGLNYGWRLKEGTDCYDPPSDCDTLTGLTDPVYEYGHGGNPFKCSVTGGFVYQGCAIPELKDRYFFGDYCSGQIWSFIWNDTGIVDLTEHTDISPGTGVLVSFGEDYFGELYVCAMGDGIVYKVVPDGPPAECRCCENRGDINANMVGPDVSDLVYLVTFMFQQGPAPPCIDNADINGDENGPDVSDLVYLVTFMFDGGPAPIPCPALPA